MSRPRHSEQTTPLLNDLRSQLSVHLQEHGAKKRLAEWLASRYYGKADGYRVMLSEFLAGRSSIGGELALALVHHLTTTPPPDGRATGP